MEMTNEIRRQEHRRQVNEKMRCRVNERMGHMTKDDRICNAKRYIRLDAELEEQSKYESDPGKHRSAKVKNVEFGRKVRHDGHEYIGRGHIVGMIPKGCRARQDTGGELVEGPWAYAFGTGSMLTASRIARTITVEVETGDVLQINGVDFVCEWIQGEWLRLYRIEDDGYLIPNEGHN